MKKILLVLSILALVSFTGCNVKNVENQEGVTEDENAEKIEKLTNLNKEKMTALVKSGLKVENETIGYIDLNGKEYKLVYEKSTEDTFSLSAYEKDVNVTRNVELAIWDIDDTIGETEITIFKNKYLVVAYKNPYGENQSALQIYDENLARIETFFAGVIFDEKSNEFKYEVQADKILASEYQFMDPNPENHHNLYRVDYEIVEENGNLIRNMVNEDKTDTAFTAAT